MGPDCLLEVVAKGLAVGVKNRQSEKERKEANPQG